MKNTYLASIIYVCSILLAATYSIMLPFLPKISKKKGVNELIIGLIMSSYALGNIITSLLLMKYFHLVKEKHKVNFFTNLTTALVLLGFGYIQSISNKYAFIFICILLRTIQGSANAVNITYFFGSLPILFEDFDEKYRVKKFFILRICVFFGEFGGILIASFLWTFLKFKYICILYGLIILVICCFSSIVFQKNKELFISKKSEKNNTEEDSEEVEVNLSTIFKYRGVLLTCIYYIIMGVNDLCIIPGYTINLIDTFKIKIAESVRIFSIGEITQIISCLGLYFLVDYLNVRYTILMSFICQSVSLILIGPCELLKIPQKLYITIIGTLLLSLGTTIGTLNSIDIFEKILIKKFEKEIANNISNNLFNIFWGCAELFGPIIGGFFSNYLGFKNGLSIISLMGIIYFILYFLLFGFSFLREKEKIEDKNIENLKYNEFE